MIRTNLLTPSGSVCIASTGMSKAFEAVRPVMVVRTGVPAFNVPFGFWTRSHTSTVVLPGSSAGLISETLAGTGSVTPGTVMLAGAPRESCWDCICERWSLASSADVSITVITGLPAEAVSPANRGRSVTTPEIGLRISV